METKDHSTYHDDCLVVQVIDDNQRNKDKEMSRGRGRIPHDESRSGKRGIEMDRTTEDKKYVSDRRYRPNQRLKSHPGRSLSYW